MTMGAALPANLDESAGIVLTFIVPAVRGCNLRCPFCYIGQRREATNEIALNPLDYADFISDIEKNEPIAAICIQGHEPLLPDSYEYTSTILETGSNLGIPTSIVTNGTFLSERIESLESLAPDKICVSLDSPHAEIHDRQRRTKGAFAATLQGLRAASGSDVLSSALSVTSVLLPKRTDHLLEMPKLLKQIGIRRWIINTLIKVGETEVGGPAGKPKEILENLRLLKAVADRENVDLMVDDEFDRLVSDELREDVVDLDTIRIHRLLNPSGVFRLLPNGQCSVGIDLLKRINDDTPKWCPKSKSASSFVNSLRQT